MKKSALILFHLLFWTFTLLLLLLVFQLLYLAPPLLSGQAPGIMDHLGAFILLATLVLFVGAVIFYASYFSLGFFLKRPHRFSWLFLGYVFITLTLALPGYYAAKASEQPHGSDHLKGILSLALFISPLLYFNVFGFLFRTFMEWIRDRKIKAELEKDKMASQLELLKAKLNPHFLFNTLNNIDVLIEDDPKSASDYLRKLSGILRFMLHESNTDKIPLAREIAYIQKYIDLQKIRTANPYFVKVATDGQVEGKYISPMILIHFIENAFKYATNKKTEGAVSICFRISGRHLSFSCKNHIYAANDAGRDGSGLGIPLLKQKLDLLYKNAYTLLTKEENNWYLVTLELELDEH